jgi:hypothetical protein
LESQGALKKNKLFFGLVLRALWVHPGTSGLFWFIPGYYLSIFSYLLVVWMYQMYIDEPIGHFKRFFASGHFLRGVAMNYVYAHGYI